MIADWDPPIMFAMFNLANGRVGSTKVAAAFSPNRNPIGRSLANRQVSFFEPTSRQRWRDRS